MVSDTSLQLSAGQLKTQLAKIYKVAKEGAAATTSSLGPSYWTLTEVSSLGSAALEQVPRETVGSLSLGQLHKVMADLI